MTATIHRLSDHTAGKALAHGMLEITGRDTSERLERYARAERLSAVWGAIMLFVAFCCAALLFWLAP